ncbi:MAG: AEC family transporter [Lachnospiraceae bacterium]|nr:AEC family transporter [Lachnospiraceae bacterium]
MDALVVFTQMMILMVMIGTGFFAYKAGYLHEDGQHQISTLIVKICNPILMFSAVAVETNEKIYHLIGENIICVVIYYVFVILMGALYFRIRRGDEVMRRTHQLMISFSNVGFFGIPLVKGLFGDEYVVLLIFYMVGFNIIAYSYGIFLAGKLNSEKVAFDWKKMINSGTVSGILAIMIFVFHWTMPAPLVTICSYLGNASIPLSMMVIGATLAQTDLKKMFGTAENYLFTFVKMLLIPAIGLIAFRFLPFANETLSVMKLVVCMPVASMAGMFCEEYGGSGADANRSTAMTTFSCCITLPLLAFLM